MTALSSSILILHLATVMEISRSFCATLNSSLSKDIILGSQNTGGVHLVTAFHAGVSFPVRTS